MDFATRLLKELFDERDSLVLITDKTILFMLSQVNSFLAEYSLYVRKSTILVRKKYLNYYDTK